MANFKITSASRQQRMLPGGNTTQVYIAWIETAAGATGSVEVPASVWEGDGLKSFLQGEADKLDRAFNLVNLGE